MNQCVQCNFYLRLSHSTFDESIALLLSFVKTGSLYDGRNAKCVGLLIFTTADKIQSVVIGTNKPR